MASNPWQVYDSFIDNKNNGSMNTGSTGYKLALVTNGYNPTLDSHTSYTDISANEVAAGNGYTTGGVAITLAQDSATNGQITVTGGLPSIAAVGGSIIFRYAVIYNAALTGTPLVAYCLVDNTPADVTVADGETLYFDLTTNGIWVEARA